MPDQTPRVATTRGHEQWLAARERGLRRYLVIGALRRGIPMALMTLALLELFEGDGFTRDRLLSADFAERVVLVLAVFLAGGALSAYARWKASESLYDDDST